MQDITDDLVRLKDARFHHHANKRVKQLLDATGTETDFAC